MVPIGPFAALGLPRTSFQEAMVLDNDLHSSDFLVIGSGISGLLFSLKVSKRGSVNLITKRSLTDSATYLAQGGIASVVSPTDSFEKHIEDTIRAGAGLCHPDVVDSFVRAAPQESLSW